MRELVRIHLEDEGYVVSEALNGSAAIKALLSNQYHLVVLDIMMPFMDGWETCKRIREVSSDVPVLMLTARSDIEDKLAGFSVGTDDYLTKPFDGRELVARVERLLRRAYGTGNQKRYFGKHGLFVDADARVVSVWDKKMSLTPKEFDLLMLFVKHPKQVYSREVILSEVWGYDYVGQTRTVDNHVASLREKLRLAGIQRELIQTVWGAGYRFEVTV